MPDTDLLLRAFGADVTGLEVKRDGIVEGLMVPYNQPADVLELINGVPTEYREQFQAGAFSRAASAPHRVGLTFTHSDLMPDRMGYGISLRDSEAGAVMTWKLYDYARDQSEELLRTTHQGLSITFRPIRPQYGAEKPGALVTRTAVHLASVAATDNPVYADARVLALRAQQDELREQQEHHAARHRAQVEHLAWLKARGRELSPAQLQYLDEHAGLVSA
jgi:HK97 family phage prohead protease